MAAQSTKHEEAATGAFFAQVHASSVTRIATHVGSLKQGIQVRQQISEDFPKRFAEWVLRFSEEQRNQVYWESTTSLFDSALNKNYILALATSIFFDVMGTTE